MSVESFRVFLRRFTARFLVRGMYLAAAQQEQYAEQSLARIEREWPPGLAFIEGVVDMFGDPARAICGELFSYFYAMADADTQCDEWLCRAQAAMDQDFVEGSLRLLRCDPTRFVQRGKAYLAVSTGMRLHMETVEEEGSEAVAVVLTTMGLLALLDASQEEPTQPAWH